MTGGTKSGAQTAHSLRPRCIRVINPETPIYHLPYSLEIKQNIHPLLNGHAAFYKYCKAKIHQAITLFVLNGEKHGLCNCLTRFTEHLPVKVKI
jgi:hypothetical protein